MSFLRKNSLYQRKDRKRKPIKEKDRKESLEMDTLYTLKSI